MDESLMDIILILLAALVAVAVVPRFDVALPVSLEVEEGGVVLTPLQIAISAEGQFFRLDQSNQQQPLQLQDLYALAAATSPNQVVEVHADQSAPATYLLEANRVIQRAGRNAVFLVVAGS